MTEDELRERAKIWQDRAASTLDSRQREANLKLAGEYTAMADSVAALKRRDLDACRL